MVAVELDSLQLLHLPVECMRFWRIRGGHLLLWLVLGWVCLRFSVYSATFFAFRWPGKTCICLIKLWGEFILQLDRKGLGG